MYSSGFRDCAISNIAGTIRTTRSCLVEPEKLQITLEFFQMEPEMYKIIPPALLVTLITACTWVQLTDEGSGVQLATSAEVSNCTRVGSANSATTSRVVVQRGGEKVQGELVTLARNEAGLMGGNTIVAASTIEGGRQSFTVYRCP